MDRIKSQNRKIYGQIQNFLRELENRSDLGVPLHGEWEGCRRAHICDDRYRVIWRDLPEIEDYEGAKGDVVVPVQVLRVGPKVQLLGGGAVPDPVQQRLRQPPGAGDHRVGLGVGLLRALLHLGREGVVLGVVGDLV